MRESWFFVLPAALLWSGCAVNSQTVRLNPTLDTSSASPLKASGTAALRVIDQRPRQEIGRRSREPGSGATITTDQNLAELIRSKVSEALLARGLQTVPFEAIVPRSLTIGLQQLDYTIVGSSVTIQAALTAALVNGPRRLDQTYSAQREQRILLTPVAKTNEEWINEVLSDVLNKLCADAKLLAFLSE